jgi:hypothetical protein
VPKLDTVLVVLSTKDLASSIIESLAAEILSSVSLTSEPQDLGEDTAREDLESLSLSWSVRMPYVRRNILP